MLRDDSGVEESESKERESESKERVARMTFDLPEITYTHTQ